MSAIEIEGLLTPVSETSPGGEDLEYDAEFMALDQAIEGTAEAQMGDAVIEAEEPNWKDIQQRTVALLQTTRDLRLLIFLLRAGIRIDGFQTLADGLSVLSGWIELYWEDFYPILDPDDDHDPTERVNALMTLCDFEVMLQPVTQIPVVVSKALGAFSLLDIRASEQEDSDEDAPSLATIEAAFTDAENESLTETQQNLQLCIDKLTAIEDQVTDLVGITDAPNFSPLTTLLKEIENIVSTHVAAQGGTDTEPSEAADETAMQTAVAGSGTALQGDIRNSQEVIKAIEKICAYYKKYEPSSPIPILLERAKRLVNMDFMSIVKDLASEGVSQVETFIGESDDDDDDY